MMPKTAPVLEEVDFDRMAGGGQVSPEGGGVVLHRPGCGVRWNLEPAFEMLCYKRGLKIGETWLPSWYT